MIFSPHDPEPISFFESSSIEKWKNKQLVIIKNKAIQKLNKTIDNVYKVLLMKDI